MYGIVLKYLQQTKSSLTAGSHGDEVPICVPQETIDVWLIFIKVGS
jgi:hypothetical protein